jgi:hypothetical protein
MEVMTVDQYIGGRHCTEYHWYEAIAHPMEASFGPHTLGSERAMSFAIYKRWSFTDPRKIRELRSGAKQPPTHAGTPFLLTLWNWIIGKNSVRA